MSKDESPAPLTAEAAYELLAGSASWESASIGYAGAPSELHAARNVLVASMGNGAILMALRNPGISLRAYLAEHVIEHLVESIGHLRELLEDTRELDVQNGCLIHRETLASFVCRRLCERADQEPRIRGFLAKIAAHPTMPQEVRAMALHTASRAGANDAVSLAREMLASDEPELIEAALTGPTIGSLDDDQLAQLIDRLRAHPDAGVRRSLAAALGPDRRDIARAALEAIVAQDENQSVVLSATRAYLGRPDCQMDVILGLRAHPNSYVRVRVVQGLARRAPEKTFAMVDELLCEPGSPSSEALQALLRNPSPAVDDYVRRLLALSDDELEERTFQLAPMALKYAARRGLSDMQGQLSRFIQSSSIHTAKAACRAVIAFTARQEIPALQWLLDAQNPHAVIAAAEALAALGAVESLERIQRAAQGCPEWARAEIASAIASLAS